MGRAPGVPRRSGRPPEDFGSVKFGPWQAKPVKLRSMSEPKFQRSAQAALVLPLLLASGSALAQGTPPRRGPPPQLNLSATDAAASSAVAARAKMRGGDCAGAVPLFDAAVRVTIEPSLRRDRGFCHDKLQNPAPAIEDYRAYLYARPEAPDAREIEERIQVLQALVERRRAPDDEGRGGASASVSVGGGSMGVEASSSSSSRAREADRSPSYDDFAEHVRRRDEAESSGVRSGAGAIFGLYLGVRAFPNKVPTSAVGYTVGVTPRYSFNSYFSLVSELGFAGYGTKARQALGGFAAFLGAEFRIKLDPYASNALLVGVGPGFERYSSLDRTSDLAMNTAHIRGKVGYRHVFGSQVGLDFTFDPAVVFTAYEGSSASSRDDAPQLLLGGNVAVVVGF